MTALASRWRDLWSDGSALARTFNWLLVLFAPQGAVVLTGYALAAPGTQSTDFPLGLQLDPRHGALHLAVGLLALSFAYRPRWRLEWLLLFGIGYLALAFFGTFTDIHFGLELELPENTLHWILGAAAVVVVWRARQLEARTQ